MNNIDSTTTSGPTLADIARSGMLITFALIQGIVFIAAIFAYIVYAGEPAEANDGLQASESLVMPAIGLLVTAGACAAAMMVPGILRRKSETEFKNSSESRAVSVPPDQPLTSSQQELAAGSQTASLVGQALLEGAAVTNLVLFFIDEHWIHFGFAAISVIGILFMAPTTGKLKQTIEDAAI